MSDTSPVFAGLRHVPPPVNDPNRSYAPGSPEKAELKARLAAMAAERIDIPLVIGGKDVYTGNTGTAVMPHDHAHVLADWHKASREHVGQAIVPATAADPDRAVWRRHGELENHLRVESNSPAEPEVELEPA